MWSVEYCGGLDDVGEDDDDDGEIKCENVFLLLSNCDRVVFQDGNGYIDRRELALMMRFIGEPVTQEEIDVRRFFSASFLDGYHK